MSKFSSQKQMGSLLEVALSCLLFVAIWLIFAPTQFGGRTGYAMITGNSMEPLMAQGDLALLRQGTSYEVGDVVTYIDPTIGPVIHRIIDVQNGLYILQGDNNDWVDPYQPSQQEVVGKLWLHIPKLGHVLSIIRKPIVLVLLTGILGLFIMGTPSNNPSSILTQPHSVNKPEPSEVQQSEGRSMGDVILLLTVLLIGAGILAYVSFTKPLTSLGQAEAAYQHSGQFSYSAPVPIGLYDSNFAVTGQPVFFGLTDSITFEFAYAFDAGESYDVQTTYDMSILIREPNGWSRQIPLRTEANNVGDRFISVFTLELAQVEGIIQTYERETGVERREYALLVTPEVNIQGQVAGESISDTFAPVLVFRTDKTQLWLEDSSSEGGSQLAPKVEYTVSTPQLVSNTVPLFGFDLPVRTTRLLSTLGIALALIGFGMVILLQFTSGSPSMHIQTGQIPIRTPPIEPPQPQAAQKVVVRPNFALVPLFIGGTAVAFVALIAILIALAPANSVEQSIVATSSSEFAQIEQPTEVPAAAMVNIPASSFTTQAGTAITLAAFQIDRYEVSNAQWRACVSAGACLLNDGIATTSLGSDYLSPAFSDYPVAFVTAYEAETFCQWRGARLPTEAEWIAAAYLEPASNTTSTYPWGAQPDFERMNSCDEGCLPEDPAQQAIGVTDGYPQAAPVASLTAGSSSLGGANMAGNVAEWVLRSTDQTYLVRGGAWNMQPQYAEQANVLLVPADTRHSGIGFRCAQSMEANQ